MEAAGYSGADCKALCAEASLGPIREIAAFWCQPSTPASQTKQRIRQDTLRAIRTRDKWVDELCDRLLHALTKYSTDASMRWVTREKLHAIVHSSMHTTSMDAERTKVLQNSESLRADI